MMHPGGIIWESMNALATAFRQKQQHHIHSYNMMILFLIHHMRSQNYMVF